MPIQADGHLNLSGEIESDSISNSGNSDAEELLKNNPSENKPLNLLGGETLIMDKTLDRLEGETLIIDNKRKSLISRRSLDSTFLSKEKENKIEERSSPFSVLLSLGKEKNLLRERSEKGKNLMKNFSDSSKPKSSSTASERCSPSVKQVEVILDKHTKKNEVKRLQSLTDLSAFEPYDSFNPIKKGLNKGLNRGYSFVDGYFVLNPEKIKSLNEARK